MCENLIDDNADNVKDSVMLKQRFTYFSAK